MQAKTFVTKVDGKPVLLDKVIGNLSEFTVEEFSDGLKLENNQQEFVATEDSLHLRVKVDGTWSPAYLVTESVIRTTNNLIEFTNGKEPSDTGGKTMKYAFKDSTGARIELPLMKGLESALLPDVDMENGVIEIFSTDVKDNNFKDFVKEGGMMKIERGISMSMKRHENELLKAANNDNGTQPDNDTQPNQDNDTQPDDEPNQDNGTQPDDEPNKEDDNGTQPDDEPNKEDDNEPNKENNADGGYEKSTVFNEDQNKDTNPTDEKGKRGNKRGPQTDEQKRKVKESRRKNEALKEQESHRLAKQLQEGNEVLLNKKEFVDTVHQLRTLVAHYDGCVGVRAPVVTINTRIKAKATSTTKPAEKEWHPNISLADRDATLKGKSIPASKSKNKWQIDVVESSPGSLIGFIVMFPVGLTGDMINGLTNALTCTAIADMYERRDTIERVPISIDKNTFITLLTITGLHANTIDKSNRRDLSKATYMSHPHVMTINSFWYSLKAKSSDGSVTKINGDGYLPVSTYNITTKSLSNLTDLTDIIFGTVLLSKSKLTQDTKYNQMEPESKRKFTGNEDNLTYTGFSDKMTVNSYLSTKKNKREVTMGLPQTEEVVSETTGTRIGFVRSKITDPNYDKNFYNRALDYKDLITSIKKTSKSSQQNKAMSETAMVSAIRENAQGLSLSFSKEK